MILLLFSRSKLIKPIFHNYWAIAAVLVYLVTVLISIFGRKLFDFFYSYGVVKHVVIAFIAAGAVAFIVHLLKVYSLKASVFAMVVGLVLYSVILPFYGRIQEKIHFVLFGVLSYAIFKAVEEKVSTRATAYVVAACITGLGGYVDEIIQYYIPDRYFDWRDVGINFVAGIMPLGIVFCAELVSMKRDKL